MRRTLFVKGKDDDNVFRGMMGFLFGFAILLCLVFGGMVIAGQWFNRGQRFDNPPFFFTNKIKAACQKSPPSARSVRALSTTKKNKLRLQSRPQGAAFCMKMSSCNLY
jgi:hypothetical protein